MKTKISDLKKYQHNEIKKINISAYKKTKNDFCDLQYWRFNVIDMCQNIIEKNKWEMYGNWIRAGTRDWIYFIKERC